nr:tRNA (adenosine(37)-N6)-threonylcarbamoyltransferase complex transferase subunit TsaD [Candidatus Woesebacteria bacterium]
MHNYPLVLAIDTSCDDTSVAVTRGTRVISNIIASQTALHAPYGGVFPTVAKLAHKENIAAALALALKRAHVTMAEIELLAVTIGPGLAPALEVGITAAQSLALEHSLPLVGVNHVEGHVLSVLASPTDERVFGTIKFPVLALVVSGGHTQYIEIKALGEYHILGSSLDDAAGECLDKIGRMLGLGYPAGPVIEEFARLG